MVKKEEHLVLCMYVHCRHERVRHAPWRHQPRNAYINRGEKNARGFFSISEAPKAKRTKCVTFFHSVVPIAGL